MLVRPADQGAFEVLMLRRTQTSHFAPDAYVFPGGTVDEADMSQTAFARARGIETEALKTQFRAKPAPGFAAPFGTPDARESAGLFIAAVRELFEEAGVLLACHADGSPLAADYVARHGADLEAARLAVHEKHLDFAVLLEQLDIYADARRLALFSQWITPPVFPRRYNAHFFLALAQRDQTASADTRETHDSVWVTPRTALAQSELGAFAMVYPTIKHLERLAQFDDINELMEFAQTKTIYSIMPDNPGDRVFSLPSDLEFAW